jgi:hypothetical protein
VTLLVSAVFHPLLVTGIVNTPEASEKNITPPLLF